MGSCWKTNEERKRRGGWGIAKFVSDGSRGRWKCRKSEGWECGPAGSCGILTSCLSLQKTACKRQSALLRALLHPSLCLSPPNLR